MEPTRRGWAAQNLAFAQVRARRCQAAADECPWDPKVQRALRDAEQAEREALRLYRYAVAVEEAAQQMKRERAVDGVRA